MRLSFLFGCMLVALMACQPIDKTDKIDENDSTQTANTPFVLNSVQDRLDWASCKQDKFGDWFDDEIMDGLECATLRVPMDNDHPNGQAITLALTRLPAKGDYPMGSLLVISGGPGDNSLQTVSQNMGESQAVNEVLQNFDVIGFAPRGIAPSMPALDCGDADSGQSAQDFVTACVKHSGSDLLKHISTQDAVLDVERIRIALGETRLSLIGYSYGTKVLARYVEQFPQSVRAAVLDGVVDVTEDYFTALTNQEAGFQKTFERFAGYCVEYEACPFEDPANYQEGFWQFLRDIESKELKDAGGYAITGDDVIALMYEKLMWKSEWDNIVWLIQDLKDSQTDAYNELAYEGADPNEPAIEDLGLIAINCADGAPANKDDYLKSAKAVDNASAYDNYRQKDDSDYLDACYYWPHVGTDKTDAPVPSPKLPQILFVAQTYDPTTPYQNAKRMAKFFNAPLISRDNDGHTIVLTGESSCIDNQVVSYLKAPTKSVASLMCE